MRVIPKGFDFVPYYKYFPSLHLRHIFQSFLVRSCLFLLLLHFAANSSAGIAYSYNFSPIGGGLRFVRGKEHELGLGGQVGVLRHMTDEKKIRKLFASGVYARTFLFKQSKI